MRTSSTCLKSELMLASLACSATTMFEECESKCFPVVDLRCDLDTSCSRAICWFSEFKSPLMMYVSSWISAGRSSNRVLRLATVKNIKISSIQTPNPSSKKTHAS